MSLFFFAHDRLQHSNNNINKFEFTSLFKIYYRGVFDCFQKMYQREGFFSYWKGIIPPVLAETPKRATKFLCFEQYKKIFMFGSDKATPLVC